MKLAFRDKKGRYIQDGQTLRFKLEDKVVGYCEFERLVRFAQGGLMGYYSPEEKRVIPFIEVYEGKIIDNAEVIN